MIFLASNQNKIWGNMDKFIKFCKKPLIIVAIILLTMCDIGLFIMMCIPNGKTYVYKYEVGNIEYTYKIELGDKYVMSHTYIDSNGKEINLQSSKKEQYDYVVSNGKLYLLDGVTDERFEVGEIESNKLSLNYNIEKNKDKTVLICKTNRVLSIIFSIGIFLGISLLAISFIVNYLDKKKLLKNDKADDETKVLNETKESQIENKNDVNKKENV